MNSKEAIEAATSFLQNQNREKSVNGCEGAWLMSALMPDREIDADSERWVVRFYRNRPEKFKNFSPGYVIVLVDPVTKEAQFADAL
jgi:hypothetical protein